MSELVTYTQTCDKSYERHSYIVYFKDGNRRLFDNWEEVQAFWFQFASMKLLSHVEVTDKPKLRTKSKGFS